ncbi:MAG: hypothetical protein ACRD2U_04285 [Terriglobales bacterium]
MSHSNGSSEGGVGTIPQPAASEMIATPASADRPEEPLGPATRAQQRTRQQIRQNPFVMIGAGTIAVALLIFVATSMPHKFPGPKKSKGRALATVQEPSQDGSATIPDKSLFPITDSGRTATKEMHEGFLDEQDMQRTARPHPRRAKTFDGGQRASPGSLGAIPPFGEGWQAPPYQPGAIARNSREALDLGKAERVATEKSSLVYVRSLSATQNSSPGGVSSSSLEPEIGLGLRTGTRLRARLESAATTAVRIPVLAVIEYNYERDGEIVVPAGSKAVGHLQDADRSGYVRIEFDSLLMPDGATVPIQAAATDLEMGPLKGKVEGENTGKNVLVRTLSGMGEVGAMLVGRGSLNQPLSESDLLRARIGNNIGEASDEQISKMTVTQHIVVTVSAGTPIYVIFEQVPKASPSAALSASRDAPSANTPNAEELRQLLQLQRELNQQNSSNE